MNCLLVLSFVLFATGAYAQSAPLQLHVLADGHVRFGDGPELDRKQWQAEIKKLMQLKTRPDLRILPDRKAPFDVVAEFLRDLQHSDYGPHIGFTGIDSH